MFEATADIFAVIMRSRRPASLLMGNTVVCLLYVTKFSEELRSWGAALFCTTTFSCSEAAVETWKYLQTAVKQEVKQMYSYLFCASHASLFILSSLRAVKDDFAANCLTMMFLSSHQPIIFILNPYKPNQGRQIALASHRRGTAGQSHIILGNGNQNGCRRDVKCT